MTFLLTLKPVGINIFCCNRLQRNGVSGHLGVNVKWYVGMEPEEGRESVPIIKPLITLGMIFFPVGMSTKLKLACIVLMVRTIDIV